MATKKQKASLQDALCRDLVGKGVVELESDLQALFKTLKGDELLEAVIARVQRYAVEASGKTVDRDFSRLDSYDADEIKEHNLCTIINDFHKDRCTAECYDYGSAIHGLIFLFGLLGYRNV